MFAGVSEGGSCRNVQCAGGKYTHHCHVQQGCQCEGTVYDEVVHPEMITCEISKTL